MKIEVHSHASFQVVTIKDDLEIITDLSELQFLIDGYITEGKHAIAVSFSDATYIYSGAIAVLMCCHKALAEYSDGMLCIIEPNREIRNIFSTLNIDKVLPIYDSADDLPRAE